MQEDLLHFIWKYKKLSLINLVTTDSDPIVIVDIGSHNHLAGPDFFNARIRIGEQLWAGNVEIHIKSSDWYLHEHEEDSNYGNVILHVVWEDDCSVFRKDGSEIPVLQLKDYVSKELLHSYQNLLDNKRKTFINCEKNISRVDIFVYENWVERLYFERLQQKSKLIVSLLKHSKNDWEQVLFILLLKNFGLKINGQAFLSLGNSLNFSIIRKLQRSVFQLEAVFFGMSHLLEDKTIVDSYHLELKKEYNFLRKKFDINNEGTIKPDFFKLRPPNFPTVRLSQVANLYNQHQNLFDNLINTPSVDDMYLLFDVSASAYWNDHFTFGKPSKKSFKKLTKNFIDLLLLNTVIPLKFCHARYSGKDINEEIISLISKIKTENNTIVTNFKNLKVPVRNAKESQALLQLYHEYCINNKCLECAVGNALLQGNV